MITYTTLGYGDIVLDEQWRLLASFETAKGVMLGWTTGIIVAAVTHVYVPKRSADDGRS